MSFIVSKRFLTPKNEFLYKRLFEKCFKDSWLSSRPFIKDPMWVAIDQSTKTVVGFCMVHDTTPYPFKHGPGAFMYNLCVAPKYRGKGAATAILRKINEEYPNGIYSHMIVGTPYHTLMTKCGWKRLGVWREINVEYGYGFDNVEEQALPEKLNLDHYDPIENVIYLS